MPDAQGRERHRRHLCRDQHLQRVAAQTWTDTPATGVLKVGALCLEVPGANTADGLLLGIDTCDGSPEQNWAFAAGPAYTPDAPSGLTASTTAFTGSACTDCTVKLYRSTGSVGAAGPGSTLVGTVTATATGTFSFTPSGTLAVGDIVTASATSPLGATSPYATNSKITR